MVELEALKMGICFSDLTNGISIPRRRRTGSSSSSAETSETNKPKPSSSATAPMSMVEAAAVLLAMAYSATDVEAFCKSELERNSRKRKRDPVSKSEPEMKQRKKKRKAMELPVTPEMPAAMRDRIVEIGGYGIQLVIQKQLQNTDMNKNHGRLSLPAKKLRIHDFVTEEERKLLNQHSNNNNKKGMDVPIIDPDLKERRICLKKWKIGSGDVYCLMTQWNSFVEETALRSGDFIQLWSFRKDEFDEAEETEKISTSRLWLAMVKLEVDS